MKQDWPWIDHCETRQWVHRSSLHYSVSFLKFEIFHNKGKIKCWVNQVQRKSSWFEEKYIMKEKTTRKKVLLVHFSVPRFLPTWYWRKDTNHRPLGYKNIWKMSPQTPTHCGIHAFEGIPAMRSQRLSCVINCTQQRWWQAPAEISL